MITEEESIPTPTLGHSIEAKNMKRTRTKNQQSNKKEDIRIYMEKCRGKRDAFMNKGRLFKADENIEEDQMKESTADDNNKAAENKEHNEEKPSENVKEDTQNRWSIPKKTQVVRRSPDPENRESIPKIDKEVMMNAQTITKARTMQETTLNRIPIQGKESTRITTQVNLAHYFKFNHRANSHKNKIRQKQANKNSTIQELSQKSKAISKTKKNIGKTKTTGEYLGPIEKFINKATQPTDRNSRFLAQLNSVSHSIDKEARYQADLAHRDLN